jgi:glycosyltransferase involved in cell wall biosynthesis
MNLLIVLITYNRLPYTKKTLRALWDTIELPYYLVIVDNNSSDGTQKYIESLIPRNRADKVILNPDNYYPGKATNIGWEEGLKEYPEATHLMRLDNDMHLEPGWQSVAERYFKKIPELGQLGLDHEAIEHPKAALRVRDINGCKLNPWPGCVGGPNIIRKSLWDMGLRYSEYMWNDGRNSPVQEDSQFSRAIQNKGYLTGHTTEEIGRTFANESNWSEFPEYYKQTMRDRGYIDNLNKIERATNESNDDSRNSARAD